MFDSLLQNEQWITYLQIFIPLLVALITALWGYFKYLREREFNAYQDNLRSLFSSNKEELLGAIGTLDFYKNRRQYRSNVIDVLINRLYTELDYDIVNAIITELSQVSSKKELVYIANKLLDINRNFVVQTNAVRKRKTALGAIYTRGLQQVSDHEKNSTNSAIVDSLIEHINIKQGELGLYDELAEYGLSWHQQAISDALAMLLVEAKQRGFTNKLKLSLYGNSFSSSRLYDVMVPEFSARFTDFSSASFQEFNSASTEMFSSYFDKTLVRRSRFANGIFSHTEFIGCRLDMVTFEDIKFDEVYFIGVEFNSCEFFRVTGLDPKLFYNCKFSGANSFGDSFDLSIVNSISKDIMLERLDESSRSFFGRWLIRKAIESQSE